MIMCGVSLPLALPVLPVMQAAQGQSTYPYPKETMRRKCYEAPSLSRADPPDGQSSRSLRRTSTPIKMPLLQHLRLPADWIVQCTTLSKQLIVSAQFERILGQLYDGQEIWETCLEVGDIILRLLEPGIPMQVSGAALEHARDWAGRQDTREFQLAEFWSRELEELFNESRDVQERIIGLTLCLFKPMMRYYTTEYTKCLLALGKATPSFCQRYCVADSESAVLNWSEERFWGGRLSVKDGKVRARHVFISLVSNTALASCVSPCSTGVYHRQRKVAESYHRT